MKRRFFLLLAALLLTAGCRKSAPTEQHALSKHPPILLIGIDGMEWNIVLKLLHQGRLPVIQQLMERGTFGLLETRQPTSSPILWTSIATGKVPKKHGINGFVHPHRHGEPRHLYTNADRKTKAFWNILSDYGRRVNCIGWWLTYPVEPINGVMVAQANTVHYKIWKGSLLPDVDGQVYPSTRNDEFMQIVKQTEGELPTLLKGIFTDITLPSSESLKSSFEKGKWAFRSDVIYERIAMKLARNGDVPDLTAVYFGGPDVVGHLFWTFMDPESEPLPTRPSEDEVRLWGSIIPDYYMRIDQVIGKLVQLFPQQSTVFLVSDHGMTAAGHHTNPPPQAFFVAAGPNILKMNSITPANLQRSDLISVGSVLDITPTLLTLTAVPLGSDMDGSVMENVLDPAFARQTRLKPVPTHDTAGWLASRPKLPEGKDMDPERLEQLRALGYIN